MKKLSLRQRLRDRRKSFIARSNRSFRRVRSTDSAYKKCIRVEAPAIFSLGQDTPRAQLLDLVSRVDHALENDARAYISLRKVQHLFPCGTLYFVSHMERLLELYPGKLLFDYPENDIVEQLFQHIGLLQLSGLTTRKSINADNVKHWHIVRGTDSDVSAFEELRHRYWETLGQTLGMTLGGSMGEAVTNCVQHAYRDKPGVPVRWWMFAEYRDAKLSVAIFDLGVGIAQSLRRKPNLIAIISRKFKDPIKHDRNLLANAVGSNLTSTKLPHRGKGLPEMLENAKACDIGGLLIHSNHGAFSYTSSTDQEIMKSFKQPLDGTLVQWTIPITEEA